MKAETPENFDDGVTCIYEGNKTKDRILKKGRIMNVDECQWFNDMFVEKDEHKQAEYLSRIIDGRTSETLALARKECGKAINEACIRTVKLKEKEQQKKVEEIKNSENCYPKDIFLWDNKEKLNFSRGRFNQHCFEIWENCKEAMLKIFEEDGID